MAGRAWVGAKVVVGVETEVGMETGEEMGSMTSDEAGIDAGTVVGVASSVWNRRCNHIEQWHR